MYVAESLCGGTMLSKVLFLRNQCDDDIIRDKPTQLQTKFGCVTMRALIILPQQKYRPDDLQMSGVILNTIPLQGCH